MSVKDIALEIAMKAHAGQKRKNGEDYIEHVKRVAKAVEHLGEDYYATGILHDTLEDSNYTVLDLTTAGIPWNVVSAVVVLTHAKKIESYLQYIQEIKRYNNDIALKVKLADLNDNLNGATGTLKDKYEMAQYILLI